MEGLLINISHYKQFALYSKMRRREFRFMRYTGDNYPELVKYITEASPATKVWEEERLERDRLYTYSGQDARFLYVPEEEIRCIVASYPYLISDEKNIPLSVTKDRAAKYLQENDNNRVFCYEDILNTYSYNSEKQSYIVINADHPNGIECAELPQSNDWYIGWKDNLERARYRYKVSRTDINHIISIKVDLEGYVETIDRLRYDINNLRMFQKNPIIFHVSWQDYQRRKDMAVACLSDLQLMKFTSCLYNIIYEETKTNDKAKKTLYKFAQHQFVINIGEIRNHYAHARDHYTSYFDTTGVDVFKKYLGHLHGATCPSDFSHIQAGLFEDCISYLEEIYTSLLGQVNISGVIEQDDSGRVHCAGILLPNYFTVFIGRKCYIYSITQNTDTRSNDVYKFYTKYVNSIEVYDIELVCVGEDKIRYCGRYRIPAELKKIEKGTYIRITRIKPDSYFNANDGFVGNVLNCKDVKIMPKVLKGIEPPTYKVEEQCRVSRYKEYLHAGNILLVGRDTCIKGDLIKLTVIENNTDNVTKTLYPYTAKYDFIKKVPRPEAPEKESFWSRITGIFK